MKKILGILVAVAMSTMAFAQTVGARGGVAINNYVLDEKMSAVEDYQKSTNTFTAAVYADFDISAVDGLFIQPEIGFTQHSLKFVIPAMGSLEFLTKTIDLPVLVGYKYNITDSLFVKGLFGPKVSFNIGKMQQKEDGEANGEDDIDNIFNFGIAAGIELGYKVGPGAVIIDARYNRDFTTLALVSGDSTTKMGKYQSFDISVGYQMAF